MDVVEQFARACGAGVAVDLRIERTDGMPLAEGQLDVPFSMIGSDPDGEITLIDTAVLQRHACLQVLGGRVLIAALGTTAEVTGPAAGTHFAWLTTTAPVKIGPFQLHLRQPVSVSPMPLDKGFNPLQPAPAVLAELPKVVMRFLNGRAATGEWTVNRLMTFVGSSPECKISLAAEDVAAHHGYFLLTSSGLWIVDLLTPNGIQVNGNPVRFARLGSGDRLRIGRFEFGFEYPDGEAPPIPLPIQHFEQSVSPSQSVVAANLANDPGTAIIRGQVVDHFRQSVVEMLESLGEMPREMVAHVHELMEQVDKLNQEVQDLETRTDPIQSVNGEGALTLQLTELRGQRKILWKKIFGILASSQDE